MAGAPFVGRGTKCSAMSGSNCLLASDVRQTTEIARDRVSEETGDPQDPLLRGLFRPPDTDPLLPHAVISETS